MLVIILALIVAASVITLFLRGWSFKDLQAKNNHQVTIPAVGAWAIKSGDYPDKMAAYKTAYGKTQYGLGVYVEYDSKTWVWYSGIYTDEQEADIALTNPNLPANAEKVSIKIAQKTFAISADVKASAESLITAIRNADLILEKMRENLIATKNDSSLLVDLTAELNTIKTATVNLQEKHVNTREQIVPSLIYTANQNILALNDVIFAQTNDLELLSLMNTAMLKNIFSLDNF